MKLNLYDKEWRAFKVADIFEVSNSKPYHKSDLKIAKKGIAYITRTSLNNGLDDIVVDAEDYIKAKGNTISLGAENADFFYHKKAYVTGNKMYYISNDYINEYVGKFLVAVFRKSILNCGFGYGKGLTGTRFKNRIILLPVNSQGEPDYEFMENYMKAKEEMLLKKYIRYNSLKINELKWGGVNRLNNKKWKEFLISDLFDIQSGVRLTKADMKQGDKPFIGATDANNGITAFIDNTNNSEDKNILGVNYNGSVVENFYHPYTAIFSDDVKRLRLKEINGTMYIYLFVKNQIIKQKSKYQYGYKFNGYRMSKQKILLPINAQGKPDYEFMSDYMQLLELKKLEEYFKYRNI